MGGRTRTTGTIGFCRAEVGLIALAILLYSSMAQAQNLPVFTSAIDITGTKLRIVINAPHRDTQQRVDTTLPLDQIPFDQLPAITDRLPAPLANFARMIPKQAGKLFTMSLSDQLDEYWNVIPTKKTGTPPRRAICDFLQAKVAELNRRLPGGVRMFVQCNFAAKGELLAKHRGPTTLELAYQLPRNSVTVRLNTPATCNPGKNDFCPDDPQVTATFTAQIATALHTRSICSIAADDARPVVQGLSFRGDTTIASIGLDLARLLFPNNLFPMLDEAVADLLREQRFPINEGFDQLRNSPTCTGRPPGASRVFGALQELRTEIDLRNRALILRAVHGGIGAPDLSVSNPGGPPTFPKTPSFTRPEISLSQPFVQAGSNVDVNGKHFPPNVLFADRLPMYFNPQGWGNSSLPVCGGGGWTEVEWGPVGRQLSVLRLLPDAKGRCLERHEVQNLTPNTAYQLRARNCDVITCSRWSQVQRGTTARADAAPGRVQLSLDNRIRIGTATTDSNGNFRVTVRIPKDTPPGRHAIHAVAGTANTSENFQVTATTTPGSPSTGSRGNKGTMVMVFPNPGEKGCPNRPIVSTTVEDTFMLFGSGFSPGNVTIRLDTLTGTVLGTAVVQANGTFCGQMRGPNRKQAGKHTLVAVQNGTVVSQLATTFVIDTGGPR